MITVWSPLFIIKSLQLEALRKYSGYLKGRVLDLGCGNAPYKNYLAKESFYVGMDLAGTLEPDVVGRVEDLPLRNDSFDSVICTEVLEHTRSPETVIQNIARALKDGGYLYLSVPQSWCLHYEPHDYFRFTKYGIRYLLEKNNFKVVAIERVGGVFSLVGSRLSDCLWQSIVDLLKRPFGKGVAERVASILVLPVSAVFYVLAKAADQIDKRDALCWAVLARKQENHGY